MKVAIIGSGISGLYAGYKLKEKGYEIYIYEKNIVIGGRVKVVKFDNIDVVADENNIQLLREKIREILLEIEILEDDDEQPEDEKPEEEI